MNQGLNIFEQNIVMIFVLSTFYYILLNNLYLFFIIYKNIYKMNREIVLILLISSILALKFQKK